MELNKAILIGRLTKDPECKETSGGTRYCMFTIAVNRTKTKNNPDPGADFISCKAWEQRAQFLSDYAHKGDTVMVEGRIETGSYDKKDGTKVYTTDVIAYNVGLLPKGERKQESESDQYLSNMADFEQNRGKTKPRENITDGLDIEPDALPFY